jgi:hypothetical protein
VPRQSEHGAGAQAASLLINGEYPDEPSMRIIRPSGLA